jgi:sec-independent protein translocase protein TatB
MSGIGFWELIILSLIGLIVLGPERLPRVANQIGNWLGQARRMTRVMKRQLEDELNFEDDLNIKPPNREPSKQPTKTTPHDDDEFSEAHEKGEVGTGVGDQDQYESDDELAVTTADQGEKQPLAEDKAETDDEVAAEEETAKEAS